VAVNGTDWQLVQVPLQGYKNNCDPEAFELAELRANNTGAEALNTTVLVDDVREAFPLTTTSGGNVTVNWRPTTTGTVTLGANITDNASLYYNASARNAFQEIEIVNGTGGDEGPQEGGVEGATEGFATGANVTSFDISPTPMTGTVAFENYNRLGTLAVQNLLTKELAVTLNATGGNSALVEPTKGQVTLPAARERQIPIYYNTTSTLGVQNATIAVYSHQVEERLDANISLDAQYLKTTLISPNMTDRPTGIRADDPIPILANASTNATTQLTNTSLVNWSAAVSDTACTSVNATFDGNLSLWKINCTAPTVPQNPINNTVQVTMEHAIDTVFDRKADVVTYRDVTAPSITDITAPSVEQNATVNVTATVTDNNQTDRVWMTVTNIDTGTTFNRTIMTQTNNTTYTAQFTRTGTTGDYDVTVHANDTLGHQRSKTGVFDVFPLTQVSGKTPQFVRKNLTFYRPSTNRTLTQFTVDTTLFNVTDRVRQRTYDVEAAFAVPINDSFGNFARQSHTVQFHGADFTGNVSEPFNLSIRGVGDDTDYPVPNETVMNKTAAALSLDTNLSYDMVDLTISYSRVSDYAFANEDNFAMYRCPATDAYTCTAGDWERVNATVDPAADTVTATGLTSFSTYVIINEGDTAEETETGEDEEGTETSTGSGSDGQSEAVPTGGAAGGATPEQGAAEKEDTAVIPFTAETSFTDAVLEVGDNQSEVLRITNNRNSSVNITYNVSGDITEILRVSGDSATLLPGAREIVPMQIGISPGTATGSYTGSIRIASANYSTTLPMAAVVTRGEITAFDYDIQIVTSEVLSGNQVRLKEFVRDIQVDTPFTANVTYFIRNTEDNTLVSTHQEAKTVEEATTLTQVVDVPDIDPGSYYLRAVVQYRGRTIARVDTFEVVNPFWTTMRIRFAAFFLIALFTTVAVWRTYKWYVRRREEQARYVYPVDYDQLPSEQDSYWVGKVAETHKEAYVDPADLTTHAIVAGSTGAGKSVTASVVVEEALENDVPVVVFDPTAQWTGFVKKCVDQDLLDHYDRFDMDSQDDPHPYPGLIKKMEPGAEIDFAELMEPGEITVFTLDHLTTEQFDETVRTIIDSIFDIEWEESSDLELVIVFDEVHRLLEKYGGKGGYEALERGAREFRKWGIGLIMSSQVTADFKQAVSGNIMTEIQMQTKSIEDIERIEQKYGEKFAKRITQEEVGTGMMQNPQYNDGDPWFVDFRPTYHNPHKIPDEELDQYHEYTDLADKIQARIDELEEQGKDMYDEQLELDLATKKLKQGRFQMAEMYLESLEDTLLEE
jgi:hypothetical protein